MKPTATSPFDMTSLAESLPTKEQKKPDIEKQRLQERIEELQKANEGLVQRVGRRDNTILEQKKQIEELQGANASLEEKIKLKDKDLVDMINAKPRYDEMKRLNHYDSEIFVDAAASGDLPMVKYCLYFVRISVNTINAKRLTALDKAVDGGHEPVVIYLFDCKAKLCEEGKPTLYRAVENGISRIVQLVLEHDARPEHRYKDRTPFFAACALAHVTCAKVLLSFGADINARCTEEHLSALDVAAWDKSEKGCKVLDWLLKQKKINVHSVNKHNKSALHWACKAENVHATKALLAAGVDSNQCTDKNQRPLDLVSKKNREEFRLIFEEHEEKISKEKQAYDDTQSRITLDERSVTQSHVTRELSHKK
ncbi:MAG: ankyrin repeat domain-containing protein [Verrucomicrobia bacterium]|nr:ankyrin repeat domain-containing protein [Verrucomicrobiota bacterium]